MYSGPGSYLVTLVASDTVSGCSDTSYQYLNIYPAGIGSSLDNKPLIEMGPNPVQDILELSSDLFEKNSFSVIISDLMGRRIYAATTTSARTFSINMKEYPAGFYQLSILNGSELVFRQKFLKR
jgi:hypothetical protein